jgi:DNA (cytosine-5)-methyltransferase 1
VTALYNEIDEAAAHVLREMIKLGVVAPGDVNTTSIKELTPDDIKGYTQVHLFAGGGLWSVAARLAGWPDDEPLWTASCPCQPFSAAGKGAGTDDPRHLWPDVHRLARALRPAVIMGEQVAQKAGYGWFDGVRADLAREGYASRSVDFPACSVDAPHQRNRQYWVAVNMAKPDEFCGRPGTGRRDGAEAVDAHGANRPGPLVHGICSGLEGQRGYGDTGRRPEQDRPVAAADVGECLSPDADGRGRAGLAEGAERGEIGRTAVERDLLRNGTYWSDAEWITCHDDKARRAKPGLRFLVDGLPGRVDLWRIGGNAIVPEAAKEVIAAFIDVYGLPSTWGRVA